MKKTFLAALAGLAVLVSCQKETTPNPLKTISYQMTSGTMYTKSVAADDVLALINSTLPEHITVVLENSKGKVTTIETGTAKELASDTYSVSGTFVGNMVGKAVSGMGDALLDAPAVNISDTPLTITDEQTEYTLAATYDCFALVCDLSVVDNVTFLDAYSKEYQIPLVTQNTTGIIFAYGNFTHNYLTVRVTPKDTEVYDTAEYIITTGNSSSLSKAEKGKWYLLSPSLKGKQPKLVSYDLPAMTQGTF